MFRCFSQQLSSPVLDYYYVRRERDLSWNIPVAASSVGTSHTHSGSFVFGSLLACLLRRRKSNKLLLTTLTLLALCRTDLFRRISIQCTSVDFKIHNLIFKAKVSFRIFQRHLFTHFLEYLRAPDRSHTLRFLHYHSLGIDLVQNMAFSIESVSQAGRLTPVIGKRASV